MINIIVHTMITTVVIMKTWCSQHPNHGLDVTEKAGVFTPFVKFLVN